MESINRVAVKEASEHVKKMYEKTKSNGFRQKYHFEVPAGWCNDPNGFCFHNGKYHLFYQHMPYVADPGDYVMCWGHAISEDLVHWEYLPVTLAPVDSYDQAGCWSGCAVDFDGKMTLIYTGRDAEKNDKQIQCMAISEDDIYFEKCEENPILADPLCDNEGENFRDPCIWKHDEFWYMVIGSSKGKFGRVLLYKSKDLKKWEYVNHLVESMGELGTVCECPNFFELDGKYILFISPHGLCERKSLYLVGDFDYTTGKYFWHNYGEIDWGMDFYAPQVLEDGKNRKIMIGWMNSWDWMPWCDGKYYTTQFGWCGGMSLPRELALGKDNQLICKPVKELETLREEEQVYENMLVENEKEIVFVCGDNLHYELKAEIDLEQTTAEQIIFEMGNGDQYNVRIIFDIKKGELIFDRTHTLYHLENCRKCNLKSVMENKMMIHIFVDAGSVEVFTDNYMTTMSNTVYLPIEDRRMCIRNTSGTIMINDMKLWSLKAI